MLGSCAARWSALALAGVAAMMALGAYEVSVDLASVQPYILAILSTLCVAALASRLRLRAGEQLADFSISFAQFIAAICIGLPLSYLAAAIGAGFPLLDEQLARLDRQLFGFDWHRVAAEVAARPALAWFLAAAYHSYPVQVLVLLILGSLRRPGRRNAEFLSAWLLAMGLTLLCYVFPPAAGVIDVDNHQAAVHAARDGSWDAFGWSRIIGIVVFPSFHTAAALVFIYAASHLGRPTLTAFIAVNMAMLASVPIAGAHYLTDMVGGAAVGALAILLAARRPVAARSIALLRRAAAPQSL